MAFWSRKTPEPAPGAPPAGAPAPVGAPAPSGPLLCSFCGKSQREVKKLISGPPVYICDECVALCNTIVIDDDAARAKERPLVPTLSSLIAALEAQVVGQPVAVWALAAALFRHQQTMNLEQPRGPIRVLLVGPRGCGKSALLRALCGAAGIPAYHADASRMSETGYIGENVENLIGALISRTDDLEAARRGILALDGLHHLVRQTPYPHARDIAGREVQRDLVRLLDGLEINAVPSARRHPQAMTVPVVCDRMMVVAAGAFDTRATDEVALREELSAAGLVDETVARFDVIVPLRRLGAAELATIIGRMLAPVQALGEPLGSSIVPGDGVTWLAERAAGSTDGAFALLAPLSRLQERVLLEAPRPWILDRALAEQLLVVRGDGSSAG
jgi:ClpX C4-type zinc finger/ATPase family associated with various cellular activities (AAA)